ncbi:MAG: thiamine pyrophosphate-dependent dehydrogenase E1 component subunit alpha, partial [Candidatus Omnitrophica bacterium]|nr:thiamine pyrophosphate-dependent dehydrogenase E1 component subunit alpha [Candidatus Omnitrophota bacterium]
MTLPKISNDLLLASYKKFLFIRLSELKVESLYHLDEMKTPIHLSLGQEQVSVGVCAHLTDEDLIF